MQRINRASWRIIETILFRYPRRKKECKEYISDIMSSQEGGSSRPADPTKETDKAQSVTEAAALRMTSVYFERAKKEIEAIELAYNDLEPEEQKVIRMRYWTPGIKKPIPYRRLTACSYSERQMQRIVHKVIVRVGKYIGEII